MVVLSNDEAEIKDRRSGRRGGAKPVQAATELPLSVIHAEALYRPVPPVEYDDEGYPGPDSKVSASTQHAETSAYTFNSLRAVFRDRPGDLIAHDLMLLFEEGNRKATLAPDLMVVLGVGNEPRASYKTWKEGKVPELVIEVVSRSTWRKDVNVKPPLYEALGIAEFWLFDPLNPRLAGFELVRGRYREIAELPEGGLRSRVLGLDLLVTDGVAVPGSSRREGHPGSRGYGQDARRRRAEAIASRS